MTDNKNIITEVLEDGTEIKIDLDLCNDVADQIMMKIFETENDQNLENYDVIATCFNVFINICSNNKRLLFYQQFVDHRTTLSLTTNRPASSSLTVIPLTRSSPYTHVPVGTLPIVV